MSTSWRLAGADLDTSTVKVVVEPTSLGTSQAIRKQTVPRLHSLPTQHNLGQDLKKWGLKFTIVGPTPDRYTVLKTIKDAFLNNDPVTLQAPDAPNEVYFNAAAKTLSLSLDALSTDYGTGIGSVALTVQATEPT